MTLVAVRAPRVSLGIGRLDSLKLIMNQLDNDDRQVFAALHDDIYRNKRAARQIESMADALGPQIEKIYEALDTILYGQSGPPGPGSAKFG
jgi:hypothetical protein